MLEILDKFANGEVAICCENIEELKMFFVIIGLNEKYNFDNREILEMTYIFIKNNKINFSTKNNFNENIKTISFKQYETMYTILTKEVINDFRKEKLILKDEINGLKKENEELKKQLREKNECYKKYYFDFNFKIYATIEEAQDIYDKIKNSKNVLLVDIHESVD